MGQNNTEFLAAAVRGLAAAHVKTWLFGGWAEELSGQRPPGPHRDIDLLYPAANFSRLDEFLRVNDRVEEIEAKRFVHKRAFRWHGVLVEVFLLRPKTAGYVTDFFDLYQFQWPENTLSQKVTLRGEVIASASVSALDLYRQQHGFVEEAYRQHMAQTGAV